MVKAEVVEEVVDDEGIDVESAPGEDPPFHGPRKFGQCMHLGALMGD